MDRAAVQAILADLMPASHTIHNRVPRSLDLEYLLLMFELIIHWTSPRSILVGLLLPTTVVWFGIHKQSA